MSVEVYLAVNLLSDAVLFGAVSRSLGLFSLRRLIAASSLCAGYAVIAVARPEVWASPPVQLALLAAASAVLSCGASMRLCVATAVSLCAAAVLAAAASRVLPLRGTAAALPCALSGGLMTSMLFTARPPRVPCWQVRVFLRVGRSTASFEALVDTGNRLREPLTGLPVLIAERSLLLGALPEKGYRPLRFGAIGGDGTMRCFRPNAVWIECRGRRRRVPDVWVAVSPDPLPGLCRALAPCEFAQYIA